VALVVRARATERAYASDWRVFTSWCADAGRRARPASAATVAAYVDGLVETARIATIRRRLAAIRAHHLDRGFPSPTSRGAVRAAVARAEWRRRHDHEPTAPLGVAELRAVSQSVPASVTGRRDRALVLVGYGAGLRPGELGDVRTGRAGLSLTLPRGDIVVPPGSELDLCAVRAWSAWRSAVRRRGGPAFPAIDRHGAVGDAPLSVRGVTRIVQRAVARAGLDPSRYSGRSLRRGMVRTATEHGATERLIMDQTGHRSRRLVRRYMRESGPLNGR
jgi:site-specific recombinase XerD